METIVQDTGAQAYYVYGVIADPGVALPDGPGIEPGAPVACLDEGGLAAVVSPVPLEPFDPEQLEAHLSDLTWLEPRARAHQAVLAGIDAPVAPLRFGTVFRDAEGVRAMLRANGPVFRATLARLSGRREWGVKILADPQRVAAYVAASSERVRGLAGQISRMSAGAVYLFQKKLDLLILEESRRLAETCVRDSHVRLSDLVAAAAGGPTARREGGDAGPELIFKGAYLVSEAGLEAFLAELDALGAQHTCFSFELTGPWPAYSFAVAPEEEPADV
jgi:hypothetical protein